VTATPAALATALPSTAVTTTAVTTTTQHQWQPNDRLPVDPNVRTGKLANGLTYIIRKNSQPGNRAELRLVVNAGSVLEADDQRGLAHFLEHMLFNGTCRFPKQSIQNFLESNGMRFGPDLNASTGFDETSYILRIPLDDPKVLDTGLNVLVDWASCATLDPTEMNRERGVIIEEHRLSDLNAQGRISDQVIENLLAGSQYAKRLPIGDMNIVQNATVDTLRRFYTDWYRPDLMAVIAVGDFDPAQVEQAVREKFSAIPARKDAPPRPTFTVPDYQGTNYVVASDPENPTTYVDLFTKVPPHQWGTAALYRQSLVEDLFYSMLNQRYTELIQTGKAPFISAGAGPDSVVRTTSANVIQAQTQETNTVAALEGLLTEVERVRRYGFTAAELERAKSSLLEDYRSAYDSRTTADTTTLVEEYIRHFLTGEDIPGIAIEYQIAQQIVPQITLEEVNQQVQGLTSQDNRLALAITPQKSGFTPPTTDQLAAAVKSVAAENIQPYVGQTTATKLMNEIPQPAAVVSKTTVPELGVTKIRLANGVQVIMKPTDFKADEVLMTGISRGGSSLLPDSDVPAARLIGSIVANSGVAGFTETQLNQLLAGKTVSVNPAIRELTQRLDGSASPRDLETAFQLIYLYATQPRLDPNAVKTVKEAAAAQLANRALAPESALQDALVQMQYGDSVRWNPVLPADAIQAVDANHAFQIYKDRFADMSDFTFTIVGNFDVAQVTDLAQRYLGNLPGNGKTGEWQDRLPPLAAGIQQKDVFKGSEDRATVQLIFPGAFAATPDDQIRLKLISDLLDLRLTAQLRQKLSGVYSPDVGSSVSLWPEPRYAVGIGFTAAPTRTKELLAATFAQIEDLRTNGPTAEELATAKEQEKRSHESELTQNAYWLSTLVNYALDPAHQDPKTALSTQQLIDKVTAADLQAAAQRFLKMDQYIQAILYPAAQQQPSAAVEARARP
jgi:zinc protease